jgi:hypothetical protein
MARMLEVEEHDLLDRIADEDRRARVVGWDSRRVPVVRRGHTHPQKL